MKFANNEKQGTPTICVLVGMPCNHLKWQIPTIPHP